MSDFATTSVPATRSSAVVLQMRRRLVLVALVACVLSGIAGLLIALNAQSKVITEPPNVPFAAIAIGEQAATDFLTYRNSSVPYAEGVNVNFSEYPTEGLDYNPKTLPKLESILYVGMTDPRLLGDKSSQTLYMLRYRATVSYPDFNDATLDVSRTYFVDVPLVAYGAENAQVALADRPALTPAATGEQPATRIDYSELFTDNGLESVNTPVREAIERWLTVFPAADINGEVKDPTTGEVVAKMSDVTKDTTQGKVWSGLGGWRVDGDPPAFTPVSAVEIGGTEDPTRPDGVVVQIEVVLVPPAANGGPSSSTSAAAAPIRATYDVYVAIREGQSEYPVIAWGAAGTADILDTEFNLR